MATREIVIQKITVPVTDPYAEGHTLTAGEAKALNQVRAENIRNNMAAKAKALQDLEGNYSQESVDQFIAAVAEYEASYEFTLTSSSGSRTVDPLEKECISIARTAISAAIKRQGRKLKDISKDTIEALIEQHKSDEKVVALAKKRLKEREGLAGAFDFEIA
jgi:ClpP class serine protease